MTEAPPYVIAADRLMQKITDTLTGPELDALWRDADFRREYDALPARAKKDVNTAGKDQRNMFTLGAG